MLNQIYLLLSAVKMRLQDFGYDHYFHVVCSLASLVNIFI